MLYVVDRELKQYIQYSGKESRRPKRKYCRCFRSHCLHFEDKLATAEKTKKIGAIARLSFPFIVMATELGLVRSLGLFFDISIVLICVEDDDNGPLVGDELFQLPWQVILVDVKEITPELSDLATLIVCHRVYFEKVDYSRKIFAPNLIWLVPRETISMALALELPLCLESNLLTYSRQGHETIIEEIYLIKTVSSNVMQVNQFGRWSRIRGLTVTVPNIWERRSNLSEVVITNTLLHWNPVIIWDKNTIGGFLGDILKTLQSLLKFKYGILFNATSLSNVL